MDNKEIASLRLEYSQKTLDIKDTQEDPIEQFRKWLQEAVSAQIVEPNVMILATVNAMSQPSSRVVLLKGIKEDGLIFYTNYQGNKAQDMAQNPKVGLTFFWAELERQVQVQGVSEKLNAEESLAYFQSRPRGSQIGAWASPQSQVIDSRAILEDQVKSYEEKFKEQDIPLPPHWGGYLVKITQMELWQGRTSRLHDRIVYRQSPEGHWERKRLAP